MPRFATIELHKEELKFSAGHFMVFANADRETLHGHDYQVQVSFTALIQQNGMAFDCRFYKQKLLQLCQQLDYRFILPAQSEYIRIEETPTELIVHLKQEKMVFLRKDVIILPISNVTMEELSYWFLQQLLQQPDELKEHNIQQISVKVFNGRGESGETTTEHMT